jgi:hypothetical protein
MAHEFLCKPLRNTLHGKARGKGVAQGVEVEFAPARVDALDFSRFKVDADKAVGVRALRKNGAFGRWAGVCKAFELFSQLRVKRHNGLVAVLGRGCPYNEARLLSVELHVGPNELGKLPYPQPREGGGKIEHAAFWRDRDKAFEFFVGKRATFLLVAANIDLRDLAQGVRRDAPVAVHPVEHRVQGVEVFIERLGAELGLLRTPADETVGGDVGRQLPAAGRGDMANARHNLIDIIRRAAKGVQVGHEVHKVLGNGLRGTVAFEPRGDDARAFAFFFGDDFRKAFLRHLLVGGAKCDFGDAHVAVQAVAPSPKSGHFDFSIGAAAWFVDVGNHDFSEVRVFKCSGYVKSAGLVEDGTSPDSRLYLSRRAFREWRIARRRRRW